MQFDSSPNPNPPDPGTPEAREVTWTVSTTSPEPVTWAVWPPGIVTVTPTADGLSATIKTTGQYGTASVRASQGGTSIAQYVWVGFLLRYSKHKNELRAMESHNAARLSSLCRSSSALAWSPAGECFVLNHDFLIGPQLLSARSLYWVKNGQPRPEDHDLLYPGEYGKGTFFAPGGGQVWSEFGPTWSPLDPADPAVAPTLKEMDKLNALVAWAPPAVGMDPVQPDALGSVSVVTCYILNIDLLEAVVHDNRKKAQTIPVKKIDQP